MILTEPKELIARYVERMIGFKLATDKFTAIGLTNAEDELIAGCVFVDWNPPNICAHIAAERMTPAFVAAIIHYAFKQTGCSRVTSFIDEGNLHSRNFVEHLGAVQEGLMLGASKRGNVCVYGLYEEAAKKWMGSRFIQKLKEAKWVAASAL